MMLFCSAVSS